MPPRPGTAAVGADSPPPSAGASSPAPLLADEESGKFVRLGIKREEHLMYYIAKGDVWATPRKMPGKPGGKAFVVATVGFAMEFDKYLYYLDQDGDICRKLRMVGGARG